MGETISTLPIWKSWAIELRRRKGLDGLSQPHVVSDEAPAGTEGEERALFLIGIEVGLQDASSRTGLSMPSFKWSSMILRR